jgi:sugar phosphate isomerase/epimerase
MKLGFITAPFHATPIDEVADWAADADFQFLELCCWPRLDGPCHLDVDDLSAHRASEMVDDMANRGIELAALGYFPNPLHPDPALRQNAVDHLHKVISAASSLSVPVVTTFIGADHTKTQQQNWQVARKVWPDIVAHAADAAVRIAIENCPMLFVPADWPSGHNLAHSPSIWRSILEEFGETVGLCFDPSHLVWQMIDIEAAIEEFAQRFYFFQAKDVTIDRRGLYDHGILSAGIGWQIPRLPGLGEIPWDRVFSALYRCGYDGPISIEHEDRDFEGSDQLLKRGLLLARDVLAPYVK